MNNEDKTTNAMDSLDSSLELSSASHDSATNTTSELNSGAANLPHKKRLYNKVIASVGQKYSVYMTLFIFLISSIAVLGIIEYRHSHATGATINEQTISTSALNHIAGNNQVIGNSNQLLTIQSNSVFNNSVLMRDNLQIAGKLLVGSSLSLTGLSVSGNSTFDQAQVNKDLSVGGNANIQGSISLQNNLSVNGNGTFGGPITAPQISVSSLQLTGNLTLTHHIDAGGQIPTSTTSSAVGVGGTASVNGSDTTGTITINSGGSPVAGCYITVNFVTPYNGTPHILLTPIGPYSANLIYYVNHTTSSFSLCSNNSPQSGQTYSFDYFVIG